MLRGGGLPPASSSLGNGKWEILQSRDLTNWTRSFPFWNREKVRVEKALHIVIYCDTAKSEIRWNKTGYCEASLTVAANQNNKNHEKYPYKKRIIIMYQLGSITIIPSPVHTKHHIPWYQRCVTPLIAPGMFLVFNIIWMPNKDKSNQIEIMRHVTFLPVWVLQFGYLT